MSRTSTADSEIRSTWSRGGGFQHLMSLRVQNIILVSSLYDSFILAEDGQLSEMILGEFLDLNLSHVPGLTQVSTGAEALELAERHPRFNLIITSLHVSDMGVLELARKVKEKGLDIPVVLLAYDNRELGEFIQNNDTSDLEKIFLWQGDVRMLLAITKYVEDRLNLEHDTGLMGVPAIVVVEDNVRYYSSFLPVIYTELMKHSQSLIPEGLNLGHKLMRIQARPKILLCETYEEAWGFLEKYPDDILGVISDIKFPRAGKPDPRAGVDLARAVRTLRDDIPVMLQSSKQENQKLAADIAAAFLLKGSPLLLHQLGRFMADGFGFGDFVFRMPDGTEVDRARDLRELRQKVQTVPLESLEYHAAANHFSRWLKTRTEFTLAEKIRPRKLSDFESLEAMRDYLLRAVDEYRRERPRGVVVDFEKDRFEGIEPFSRIGGGSLGGKARGLAFVGFLLKEYGVADRFPGVRIAVPPSVVLGTEIFEDYLDLNGLRDVAIESTDDRDLLRRFVAAPFRESLKLDLKTFLDAIRYPLAVRSSSLLEDNQFQPFAGIYETYMLPNNHPDPEVRLAQLSSAIKQVYASAFSSHAKEYLRATPYRLEEEQMAVLVQQVVGARHGHHFYPDFAGVGRSYNYYPIAPFQSRDGIAAVALGLGKTVVEGERCLRFCPRYPKHILQFSSVKDFLNDSQNGFWALDLKETGSFLYDAEDLRLEKLGLDRAEQDGVLHALGSTYSPENDAVYDGLSRAGARLVSFAPILKHGRFPLSEILSFLLETGEQATNSPVEIEFAVNLSKQRGQPSDFGFLQMRPLALTRELEELEMGDLDDDDAICTTGRVLGHGWIDGIQDIVVVDYHRYDRSRSMETAREVAQCNAELSASGTPYVLIGVGRWGSADPWLGIPVAWDEIAGARVIVESGFRDMKVTPSQGTHFFQNLTSNNIGYFTVNQEAGEGFVDWPWLAGCSEVRRIGCVRHLRFDEPILVVMNGKTHQGWILKPGVRSGPNANG